jgi:hypothetical protein
MSDQNGKKDQAQRTLPTVEQIETIIDEWGACSVADFAERFQLDKSVIEETVEHIRHLKRAVGKKEISPVACLRSDSLLSRVRCAGAHRGYK